MSMGLMTAAALIPAKPVPRFRPGAGGGAAAVHAQTERKNPTKFFPARAFRREK